MNKGTVLQNPPALKINEALYSGKEMPPHVRLEQRIAWNLFLILDKAGFEPLKVDSGDEVVRISSWKGAMELLFNLDDAFLIIRKKGGDSTRYIRFVFGNEYDIVSDYSYAANDADGFGKLMDEFKPEVYA